MTEQEDTRKKPRRDLLLVLFILPLGILCMFMTGQAAIKLAPEWVLEANMRSMLDPNATFVAQGIPPLIEPLNPAILTRPAWGGLFLTPRAVIPTRVVVNASPTPVNTPPPPPAATPIENPEPTATLPGLIILPTRVGPSFSDLAIQVSDNSSTYTPGTQITYTITITNLGPDDAPRFNIIDNIPAIITGLTVTCTPANLCGTNTSSGNTISFTGARLPAVGNNQITITISGTVASSATGNLVNTARIDIPSGVRVIDPGSDNNSSTDTDAQLSVYDLAVTKSNRAGINTYVADQINYRIVVTNNGPSDATGVTVVDNRPLQIASWTWACAAVVNAGRCNGGTSSSFNDLVDIRSGGRIEYLVSAIPVVLPALQNPQNISNTVNITFPADPTRFIDPNTGNNSATVTDIPYIDLFITKDDGATAYLPGTLVTYTITVTNNSSFNLTGITISDPKPLQVSDWVWCVSPPCPAPITTDFASPINLAAGGSQAYTVTANISGTATGDLTNIATVNPPAGLVDAIPGNNSATDTNIPGISVDLSITKDDGVTTYTPGGPVNYTVTVTNHSAIDLTGVTVTDVIPALIDPVTWTWTCVPAPGPPGASCTTGPSNTSINDAAVSLPPNASVVYSITATVLTTATGSLSNSASVSAPSGFVDTVSANNTATDVNVFGTSDLIPPQIGTTPDNNIYQLPEGGMLTLNIPTVVNGHAGPDLVFYEYLNMSDGELYLDWIQVQVGDGANWYTVFNWGDEIADINSNMNFNVLLPPVYSSLPPEEADQRHIQAADLTAYPPSGISIDLDGYAPPGAYPYVRIISPSGDEDGQLELDAIRALP